MKNIVLATICVLSIICLLLSGKLFLQVGALEARVARDSCAQACDSTRDRALGENQLRRTEIDFDLQRELRDCRINNLLNESAIALCQAEKLDAAQLRRAGLDASDEAIREVAVECRKACANRPAAVAAGIERPIEVCLEGGAPCFKEVLEVCTIVSGPCDECWTSLCGGGDWAFESELPLVVTLVAATDPAKDARVLATSSMNGEQAILSVPSDIEAKGGERLYLGFSSKEGTGGAVKVRIRRNR
jgi:hypothetical protein